LTSPSEAQPSGFGRNFLATLAKPICVKVALIVLGVLPALILLIDIRVFAVNVPFMDDWQFVPLLEKAKNGTLTFQELVAPHDEHRLLLPRIIIIGSMFATGGDYRAQSYITFAVVAVISAALLWLLLRLNDARNSVLLVWGLANVALFSPIQFHNWLWPMQFAYFLPYTFLALCFCVLYARLRPLPKFAGAAVLALAGNYSFVQGNLIWAACLPLILFAPGILPKVARKRFAIAWLVLAPLSVGLYFHGLEHNSAVPDYAYGHEGVLPTMSTLHQLHEHPARTVHKMALFVVSMFGTSIARGFPVSSNLVFSQICGGIVLALALIGLTMAARRGRFLNFTLPWGSLLLFTFLTAAFVCVGRVWRGEFQPLTPRYTTFGSMCIVSLIPLLHSAFSGPRNETEQTFPSLIPNGAVLRMQGLLAGFYLCVQAVNWIYGQDLMREWRLSRWHAQARLHFLGKINIYAGPNLLGGKEELIEVWARILEELGMLKPPRATDLRISALGKEIKPDGERRGVFEGLSSRGSDGWHAYGSALSTGNRAADAVILGVQNGSGEWIPIAAATPISPLQYQAQSTRMDLEFLPISGPRKRGEWEIEIPFVLFSQMRGGVIRAWAMDYPRRMLYQLPGDQRFTVPPEQDAPPKFNALGAAGSIPGQ
jgi:hypothetical protein